MSMPRVAVICGLVLTASSATAATPSTDAARIASQGLGDTVAPCSSCHGADGGGNAAGNFPRLSGLGADYLAAQLAAFADGTRANPVMKPIAGALSADQRRALAAYYSQRPIPEPAAQTGASQSDNERGRRLALHGRWDDGVPACVQCHGPNGVGVGSRFPALAGQPAGYLENQLRAWRDGARGGDPMGLMSAVARRLDAADIPAAAQYFAALPANPTATAQADHE